MGAGEAALAELVVGPAEEAKDVVADRVAEREGEGPGRRAAGPVELGSARQGCRADPGAGSVHALRA
ncbi:MAG: hypothetical protein ACWGSD_18980, partial [Thermodesulfobacteriota bacterium]